MAKRKLRITSRWLLLIALLVLITTLVSFFVVKGNKHTPATQVPNAITYSTDTPDENKPADDYKWLGSSNEPKRIILPNIQVSGYIQKVGVDQHKQVAVPNNIHFAGWFADSVLPGEQGLSIIDGHVDGRQATGIFKQLANLKDNDTYQIEFGSGIAKSFRVKKVVTVDTKDAAGELFSQDPQIVRQVNLITCGGTFDTQSKQYNKRVIVVSELM